MSMSWRKCRNYAASRSGKWEIVAKDLRGLPAWALFHDDQEKPLGFYSTFVNAMDSAARLELGRRMSA